jgi:hypothetical protein
MFTKYNKLLNFRCVFYLILHIENSFYGNKDFRYIIFLYRRIIIMRPITYRKQHNKIKEMIIKSLDIFITSISSNDDINLLYMRILKKFLYMVIYVVDGWWLTVHFRKSLAK